MKRKNVDKIARRILRLIREESRVRNIIEILNTTNEVLADIKFEKTPLAKGRKTTVRSGLPTLAWRKLNSTKKK